MTGNDSQSCLARNLEQTYFAIATGIPGSETVLGKGWKGIINSFPHPICNFGLCHDVESFEPKGLLELASDRPHFSVYACRFGDERGTENQLGRAGFSKLFSLSIMACGEAAKPDAAVLREALAIQDRRRTAEFMIWQFFSTQSPEVREKITSATVQSQKLQLYELVAPQIRERPAAAVMLHRTQSVLGLYNLCVGQPFRSRGIGTSIIYAVQQMSVQERVILGLQCDPVLTPWYRALGMVHVGDVDIYGLQKASRN